MKIGAALSTGPDPKAATAEAAEGARSRLDGAEASLAVLVASRHHAASVDVVSEVLRAAARPERVIGCVAETVVGGGREVEDEPAVSVWLASLPQPVETFHMEFVRTSEGGVLGGYRFGAAEQGAESNAYLLIGDPFSFPADLLLEHLNERVPGTVVMGGMASGGRWAAARAASGAGGQAPARGPRAGRWGPPRRPGDRRVPGRSGSRGLPRPQRRGHGPAERGARGRGRDRGGADDPVPRAGRGHRRRGPAGPARSGGEAGRRRPAVHLQRARLTPVPGPRSRRVARRGVPRRGSARRVQLRGRDRAGRREELPPRLHRVDRRAGRRLRDQLQSTVTISTGSVVPRSVTVRGSESGNRPSAAGVLLAMISSPSARAAIRAASCTPLPAKLRPTR